jgi:hypothetical protein
VAEPPGKDQFAAAYAADNESNATNRVRSAPSMLGLLGKERTGARQARI